MSTRWVAVKVVDFEAMVERPRTTDKTRNFFALLSPEGNELLITALDTV